MTRVELLEVYAPNRQAWRDWLTTHHQTSKGVWLVYYKVKSGKPSILYSEAVQEALCFGWIDSKVNRMDEERYKQVFTPRKPTSVWSKLNKQYVEALMAANLMTKAGLAAIEIAKSNGSWESLDEIEALIMPSDLQEAFFSFPDALAFFETCAKSYRKNIFFYLQQAKREETRKKRLQAVVEAASQGKRLNSI